MDNNYYHNNKNNKKMYGVTPEQKRLAELRSRHDKLYNLEKSLNLVIENPNIPKRDVEEYISRVKDSEEERRMIVREMKKYIQQ
jgi:hypothetical protein